MRTYLQTHSFIKPFSLRWGKFLALVGFIICAKISSADSNHHPVFDFYNNRLLAHIEHHGGLLLLGGSPGFVKYIQFGRPQPTWRIGYKVDNTKVSLAGTVSKLTVPLTKKQSQNLLMSMRLKVPKPSSVKVYAGDKSTKAISLTSGWQIVDIELPAASLKEGENALRLEFAQKGEFNVGDAGKPISAAAAVEWIQIGGQKVGDSKDFLAAISDVIRSSSVAQGNNLVIPGQGALYYYVDTGERSLVARGQGNGCTLRVSLAEGKDHERTIDLPLDGTEQPLSIAGNNHVGTTQVRRLGLHAQGSCKQMILSQVQMVAPGPSVVVKYPSKPKNIIFWLSDDTRADKFKLWNPKSRVETPVLDEFSKKATRFAVMYTQGNESRVSHASLFTGLYPKQHNFIADKAILSNKWIILPEAVKPAGLFTIGRIANGYITKRWGFGDGWDILKNHIHEGGGLKAEDLIGNVREFLQKGEGKTKPFFFYIGSIDAHVSWRAHEPWISKYDRPGYTGPFVKGLMDPQLDQVVAGNMPVSDRDKARIIALYDSDISYTDQQFGELLKLLKATGHENDTMIVFTSDHGEEFWDHGKIGHSQSLHPELIHVPLWIYYPPLFPGGKVVHEGVELVDMLPTITDALGIETPKDVQGESLIALAQGASSGYPRPAISSKYEQNHTMRLGDYKILVGGDGEMKLYNAATDFAEEKELAKQKPVEARFVADAMSLWLAYQSAWKKSKWGVASNHLPAFAADLEASRVTAFTQPAN